MCKQGDMKASLFEINRLDSPNLIKNYWFKGCRVKCDKGVSLFVDNFCNTINILLLKSSLSDRLFCRCHLNLPRIPILQPYVLYKYLIYNMKYFNALLTSEERALQENFY